MAEILKRLCPAGGNSSGEKLYKGRMILPETFDIDSDYDIVSGDNCGCCYGNVSSTE